LWSKDGTKIAFSRKIDRAVALADLVVVDPENGRTLARTFAFALSFQEKYTISTTSNG
jgi:hypothetical protein